VIAIDSNVFIYFLESNDEFGPTSLALFKKIEQSSFNAVASELIFFEVLASSKIDHRDIEKYSETIRRIDVTFKPTTKEIYLEAARLRRQCALGAMDAIHVATAIVSGATHFVTNDKKLLKRAVAEIELVSLQDWHDSITVSV